MLEFPDTTICVLITLGQEQFTIVQIMLLSALLLTSVVCDGY